MTHAPCGGRHRQQSLTAQGELWPQVVTQPLCRRNISHCLEGCTCSHVEEGSCLPPAVTGWRWQGNSSFSSPPPLGAREQQPVSLLTLPEDPLLWTPILLRVSVSPCCAGADILGRSPSWPCVWWHYIRVYHDSCQRKLLVSPKMFLISTALIDPTLFSTAQSLYWRGFDFFVFM